MQIKNNVFVVTGAAQGLGASISVELARQGAHLALLDVNAEALEQTRQACTEAGSGCRTFICDVADENSVQQCFAEIEAELGGISGLINNAGMLRTVLFWSKAAVCSSPSFLDCCNDCEK